MSWLTHEVLPALTMLAYFVTSMRILMFHRGHRKHCPRYSALASVLVGVTLSAAAEILILESAVSLGQFVTAAVFLLVACRAKGNVAQMMMRIRQC